MSNFLQLFFQLLMAHLLADFFLQSKYMLRQKRRKRWKSPQLALHALIAGFLAYLFAAQWQSWLLVGIGTAFTHWLVDAIKVQVDKQKTTTAFIVDQLAHIAVIVTIAILLTEVPGGLDEVIDPEQWGIWAVYGAGLLLLFRPSSIFIQFVSGRWAEVVGDRADELPNAGAWIGYLERLLIFLFILVGEYAAIGLLIAAKSILRFRDDEKQRLTTEYILLGTLLSFTIAILIGMGVRFFAASV
ncbi:DUF3307 domain-containing protein [Aliifodinibius salicampi]|uniref:DUF3307 domain-containing protein n=1 Tax=Fodinibius salicampi TaxID=1920655 RepID=A0ABT3Q1M4_9BACT|nr:DUF3307 domain-containing protein [Fodinibius salicampi]MCW9714024.1 DUF3307 domain-containing protein [Fodinibius salicampi]